MMLPRAWTIGICTTSHSSQCGQKSCSGFVSACGSGCTMRSLCCSQFTFLSIAHTPTLILLAAPCLQSGACRTQVQQDVHVWRTAAHSSLARSTTLRSVPPCINTNSQLVTSCWSQCACTACGGCGCNPVTAPTAASTAGRMPKTL
jgi:hypothetical protein